MRTPGLFCRPFWRRFQAKACRSVRQLFVSLLTSPDFGKQRNSGVYQRNHIQNEPSEQIFEKCVLGVAGAQNGTGDCANRNILICCLWSCNNFPFRFWRSECQNLQKKSIACFFRTKRSEPSEPIFELFVIFLKIVCDWGTGWKGETLRFPLFAVNS